MKKTITVLAVSLILPLAAQARSTVDIDAAQAIALKQVPGEILESGSEREDSILYHEFTIRRADGTVVELEISAEDGSIAEVEVESLGEGADLPPARITEEQAQEAAIAHVEEKVRSSGEPEIMESEYLLLDKKLVYEIGVRKGFKEYDIRINAYSGNVIYFHEEM